MYVPFLNKIYLEISSPRQRLLNLFIFRTKTIHLNWKIKLEICLVRFFKYRTIKRLIKERVISVENFVEAAIAPSISLNRNGTRRRGGVWIESD